MKKDYQLLSEILETEDEMKSLVLSANESRGGDYEQSIHPFTNIFIGIYYAMELKGKYKQSEKERANNELG